MRCRNFKWAALILAAVMLAGHASAQVSLAPPPAATPDKPAAAPAKPAPAEWGPWSSAPFPVTDHGADGQIQPALTAVAVAPGDAGWQLSLVEAGNALTVPVGSGAWTVSQAADRRGDTIPVAASGGWLDGGTLRAEIIFLETPHRMDITCSLPQRTAEAGWRHPPITPSKLKQLHCPS